MSKLFASASRNAEFHSLFKNIPPEELLIDSYSCALSREILIHGRLYLSANYICFNANLLGWVTSIVLNLKDIVSVEKKMTALIIPNGLALSTLHTRHVYASFLKRDDAYNKITRVWKNCISDQPIPTTELLAQLNTGKDGLYRSSSMDSMISTAGDDRTISGSLRFRERKLSAAQLSEGGMESIMSEDALAANSFPNNDPALTVRREFNFGASRLPVLLSESRHELSEERATGEAQNDSSTQETDEEQREVRESIFPCSCAFHYKSTIVDQLVLLPLSSMTERLLFTPKNSLTCAPFAFIQVLKQLGAKEVSFSPWKVYLGRWERRVWSCQLPATKLLLSDALITVKVTDSIISRGEHRVCIESLMQVDGVPGGGCFVKWKLCATAPTNTSTINAQDQCRITITAAAAAPLGSWFKESIRAALLYQAEELWTKAIECAANDSEASSASTSSLPSHSPSNASLPVANQNNTNNSNLLPTNKSLGSVSLVYFDRKIFFRSMTRMITLLGLVVLGTAIVLGRQRIKPQKPPLSNDYALKLQSDYARYVAKNLAQLPEDLINVGGQLAVLDGRVAGLLGRMQSIRRYMHEDEAIHQLQEE